MIRVNPIIMPQRKQEVKFMELSEKISVKIRGCLEDLGLELNDYLLGIGETRVYNIADILNKHNI